MYHQMAEDELNHANYLMEMAREYMNGLSWLPEEDKERFEHCEGKHAECAALTRLILQA